MAKLRRLDEKDITAFTTLQGLIEGFHHDAGIICQT